MTILDKIIHERVRLLIMTYLASAEGEYASFNEMQKGLDLTSGNLSVQLRNLKQAGYLKITKSFQANRPHTTIKMTETGAQALNRYIEDMERIIKTLKK